MLKCLSLVVVLGLTRKFLADYIKGVSKEMQNLYQSTNGKFKCLNDGKEVPYVYVNDDYCDCSDGSDEPGTSACNNGIFWCQNTGHRQKRILSMDVGDKICNCCDGSDEAPGLCENTCYKIAEAEKQERLRIINLLTTAHEMIKENEENFPKRARDFEAQKPQYQSQIDVTRNHLKDFEVQLEKFQQLLESERFSYKEEWAKIQKVEYSRKLFEVIDSNKDNIIDSHEAENSAFLKYYDFPEFEAKIKELSLSYNEFELLCSQSFPSVRTQESREHDKPVPDDYEVPESDDEEMHKSSTDHDNIEEPINDHPEDGDDLDEPVDQESEELDYEYGEDGQKIYKNNESVHKRTLAEIRQSAHKYDDMHRDFMSKLENPTNAKIQELETLIADNNAKVKSIQSELSQLIRNLQFIESFSTIDFGPKNAYSLLFNLCLHYKHGKFDYKICPFSHGTQNRSDEVHVLGYWKGWADVQPKYSKMLFDDGDTCYRDIKRSFEINLSCHDEHQVTSISEEYTCKYVVDIKTPAACVDMAIPRIHEDL